MTCSYFRSLLDDFIDRELSTTVETSLKGHLDVCEACRAEYEESIRLRELLSDLTVPEPATGYWQEAAEIIKARTIEGGEVVDLAALVEQHRLERVSFFRSLVAVAASLIVFFGSLLIGSSNSLTGEKRASALNRGDSVAAGSGAQVDFLKANYISPDEQELITGGMLLVGTPGMLAGSSGLAILFGADRTR